MNAHNIEAQNLALAQQIYADFAAGNIEAILALSDPAIEWISGGSRDDFPTLGARQGIEGAASFFKDVAAYDQFTSFEPRQMVAMGDMVVALGHYGITVKQTGKHFESDWAHAFTIRGGKCVKFQEFTDTAAFLKAGRA
jgi:ketosteroid isomerase-like protein